MQPAFGGPVYFIRNVVYHAPEGGAVKFTASSAGIVVYHNTLIAPVKPMLLAASNVHYRNNLILGKSETLETFAVETNTNYSSSDYNGFRPNEGAEFSFEWSTPPLLDARELSRESRARYRRSSRASSRRQRASSDDSRRLKEYSAATGQDTHSVLVDYDVFVKVTPPGPDPRTLYKPADFDFQLRAGSVAVDAGVRLPGINDDFTGKAPDLGAYEVGRPCRTTARGSERRLQPARIRGGVSAEAKASALRLYGIRDDRYAAIETKSSSVSFATTGFIRSVHTPWRAPACMSYICRTM